MGQLRPSFDVIATRTQSEVRGVLPKLRPIESHKREVR